MTRFQKAAAQAGLPAPRGLAAVRGRDRKQIKRGAGAVSGSVAMDAHFQQAEPHAHRWDYGVGFSNGKEFAVWVEFHPASGAREVQVVIAKLQWLKTKLASQAFKELNKLTVAAPREQQFCWLYQGSTAFRSGGKEQKLLAQHGMRLPRRALRII